MNRTILIGRLTKEPEIRLTPNQVQFCGFTIAVDRKFKDANGQRQADFINCLAWKQTAVFIQKYFHKGNRIGVVGSIQTRSYEDQNGQKRFVTEVIVDEVDFVESHSNTQANANQSEQPVVNEAPVAPVQQESGELPFEV